MGRNTYTELEKRMAKIIGTVALSDDEQYVLLQLACNDGAVDTAELVGTAFRRIMAQRKQTKIESLKAKLAKLEGSL